MSATAERPIGEWLERLGSEAATPGGGAFAALSASAGAALIAMVGRLTIGRKDAEDLEDRMRGLVQTADEHRVAFLELADRDAAAFDAVMAAFRLPKETEEQKAVRASAIQEAYVGAAEVPLEVARRAVGMMELAEDATAMGNPNAASDGYSAAAALFGGALCAIANVEINASGLRDQTKRLELRDACAALRARADGLLVDTQTAFELRLKPE
jgi:formiminotetrahydrofolate cyclodeaminase